MINYDTDIDGDSSESLLSKWVKVRTVASGSD